VRLAILALSVSHVAWSQSAPAVATIAVAPTPVIVNGVPRLVYELQVRNPSRDSIGVQRIRVLDADRGTELTVLEDRRVIAPAASRAFYLEVTTPEPPRRIAHRIDLDAGSIAGPTVSVGTRPPVELSPPLRGGPWAAIYDPSWERGHRRVFYTVDGRARVPGRFAIDWIKLDAAGRFATSDADSVRNWIGYGADVLAVADAVVAATRDGFPESATVAANHKHSPKDASGNYIALDVGAGRYVFYEHLKPGSVRVRQGDRVRRGQVIAALGYTGDSTGPHLHLHVADAASTLGAEGVPYVFQSFEVIGVYESLDTFGKELWKPLPNATRNREYPGPKVVVNFR
jgi:hypothetical protein